MRNRNLKWLKAALTGCMLAAAGTATGLIGVAHAATIVSPGTVINNTLGEFGTRPAAAAIDQSGLSVTYSSGVTDFSTYIGLSPSHGSATADQWLSALGNTTGTIDFDLASTFPLNRILLWNHSGQIGTAGAGINGLTVFTSNVSDFSTSVNVGTFSALSQTNPVQVFNFNQVTNAQFVRLQINSNHGNASFTGAPELAFATPEPTTALLFASGLAALAVGRRRMSR